MGCCGGRREELSPGLCGGRELMDPTVQPCSVIPAGAVWRGSWAIHRSNPSAFGDAGEAAAASNRSERQAFVLIKIHGGVKWGTESPFTLQMGHVGVIACLPNQLLKSQLCGPSS